MHIICPHCTTSYAINLATLGAAGRTVRCSRCKEVWLARPEDAVAIAPAMAEASQGSEADWPSIAQADAEGHEDAVSTHRSRLAGLFRLPPLPPIPGMPRVSLPVACAAMGALALALIIWRADMVRLLPQTATF